MSELLTPQFDQGGVRKDVSVTLNSMTLTQDPPSPPERQLANPGRSFNKPAESKTNGSDSSSSTNS